MIHWKPVFELRKQNIFNIILLACMIALFSAKAPNPVCQCESIQ